MWRIPTQRSDEQVVSRPATVIDLDAVVAGMLPLTGSATDAVDVRCGVLSADLRR